MSKRLKRSAKKLKRVVGSVDLHIKANEDGKGEKLVIRGLANANVIDRGSERVLTDAWQLDNFKKNPVILLNHGFDVMGGLPIGKAIKIEPTEDGLVIEAEISESKNGQIPMVADLIRDGFLSTFSVGFDLIDGHEETVDGKDIFTITKAELFEVSVVGIPMNQDSTFAVVSKDALKSGSLLRVESDMLRQNKSHVQANIMDMLDEQEYELDEFLKSMVRRTKRSKEELKDTMLGKGEADSLFISKARNFLDCSFKDLHSGDENLEKLMEAFNRIEDGDNPSSVLSDIQAKATEDGNDNEADNEESTQFTTGKNSAGDSEHTHTYSKGDEQTSETDEHRHPISEDGTIGEADGHTHSADPEAKAMDSGEDDDESSESSTEEDDESQKAEEALKDFQDCVNEKIPKLINDEGMEQDQAVAVAIEQCSSEKGCDISEFKNSAYAECFAAATAMADSGEWKDIDFTEIKQALAEGQDGNTEEIDTTTSEKEQQSDPHLMAAQQTNVLLGSLLNMFDTFSKTLEQIVAKENTEQSEEEEEAEQDTAKSQLALRIEQARAKQLELTKRITDLNA